VLTDLSIQSLRDRVFLMRSLPAFIELETFLGVLETHYELARDYLAFLARTVLDVQAQAREAAT
jgi:hypothetical protein